MFSGVTLSSTTPSYPSIHPSIHPSRRSNSTRSHYKGNEHGLRSPRFIYYCRSSLLWAIQSAPTPILHLSITRAAHYSSSPEIHRPGWKVAKERQPQTVNNSAFPHSITIPNHDYRRPATRDRRMVQFSACNDELLHRLIISIANDHPNRTDRTAPGTMIIKRAEGACGLGLVDDDNTVAGSAVEYLRGSDLPPPSLISSHSSLLLHPNFLSRLPNQ